MENPINVLNEGFTGKVHCLTFLDESYSAPAMNKPPHFYIFAAVTFDEVQLELFGKILDTYSSDGYFHTSEEAKTSQGRQRVLALISGLLSLKPILTLAHGQIDSSDKFGEASRSKLFREVVNDVYSNTSNSEDHELIYERRQPGYPAAADARTISALRRDGVLPRGVRVSSNSLRGDFGLVAPDLLAWAFRKSYLGQDSSFWDEVMRNSKPRLP